jgi:putative PIN family toxin of toxin-antitoxin system
MWRIVLDTNILVSAILSKNSGPYKIMNMVFDEKFSIYYSLEMLAEYENVLYRKKLNLNIDKVENVLTAIKIVGVLVPHKVSSIPIVDEDDRVFYDVAKTNAALLITGNRKHFPKDEIVLTPAEFLDAQKDL